MTISLKSIDVESANSIALRSFPDLGYARQTIDFIVNQVLCDNKHATIRNLIVISINLDIISPRYSLSAHPFFIKNVDLPYVYVLLKPEYRMFAEDSQLENYATPRPFVSFRYIFKSIQSVKFYLHHLWVADTVTKAQLYHSFSNYSNF